MTKRPDINQNRRIRIPPHPPFTLMVDREDGTEWILSWDEEYDGTLRFAIDTDNLDRPDPLPDWQHVVRYAAYEGPVIGGNKRLLIRGGRLGYEMLDTVHSQAMPAGRIGVIRRIMELIVASTWTQFPDTLAWEEIDLND